jgi:hypothetical protein
MAAALLFVQLAPSLQGSKPKKVSVVETRNPAGNL